MQILEQVEIKIDWKDLNNLHNHPVPSNKRSKGIHVTDILKKIAIKTKVMIEREIEDEFAPIRVALGMGWEWLCARLYPNMQWQPGELKRDGIIGSPDGQSLVGGSYPEVRLSYYEETEGLYLSIPTYEVIIEEFKYTALSLREKGGDKDSIKDISRDWLKRNQVLAYLAMHPDKPSLVRWHICYGRGNYDISNGMQERYVRYLVRFTRQEIDGAWGMLKKYKYL